MGRTGIDSTNLFTQVKVCESMDGHVCDKTIILPRCKVYLVPAALFT